MLLTVTCPMFLARTSCRSGGPARKASLKGKTVGGEPYKSAGDIALLTIMTRLIGLDPSEELHWVMDASLRPMDLFFDGKIERRPRDRFRSGVVGGRGGCGPEVAPDPRRRRGARGRAHARRNAVSQDCRRGPAGACGRPRTGRVGGEASIIAPAIMRLRPRLAPLLGFFGGRGAPTIMIDPISLGSTMRAPGGSRPCSCNLFNHPYRLGISPARFLGYD